MKLILILLLAANLWAANYNCTSTGTGDFNAAGTWASCNSTYPNNSTDTFTFSVGVTHVVTLPSGAEATVGQSLAANTAQGTVANTGKIVLAADLTGVDPTILTMKGDLAITTVGATCTLDGATNCNGVEMNPGTVLLIDSDGSGTAYAIGQTSNGSSRWFKADCTDTTALSTLPTWSDMTTYQIGYRVVHSGVAYISVANSNTGNTPDLFNSAYWQRGNCAIISVGATNAVMGLRGFGFGGGNVYFRHVAMRNFGTSSVDAVAGGPHGTNNANGGVDITHSSFAASGAIDTYNGERTATSVHRFSNNIITGSLMTSNSVVQFDSSTNVRTSGVREFKENVILEGSMGGAGTIYCEGCTVEGNYVDSFLNLPAYRWVGNTNGIDMDSFVGNFWLKHIYNSGGVNVNAAVHEYNYVVNGAGLTNIRAFSADARTTANQDVVMQYNVAESLSSDTSGDCFMIGQSNNGRTHTLRRNATGLGPANTSACNIITYFGITGGGTDNLVFKNNSHIGTTTMVVAETNEHAAGSMTVQNNMFARYNSTGTGSKVADSNSCTTNPNDVCSAAQCNYNVGVDLSYTPPGTCTNAHNGYSLDLSAATGWGANDTNLSTFAEAQYADITRSFATAATDFFGQSATAGAWSGSSVSYAVGDIVSDSQSIWQGKTVLYRALAAHTSAATTRPGNGATWQSGCSGGPCWEYATAYFVREAIGKGQRWTDASIGANNDYVPKALALWYLHGRISHRRDLQCTGNDGESPWPIPYCERGRTVVGAITNF